MCVGEWKFGGTVCVGELKYGGNIGLVNGYVEVLCVGNGNMEVLCMLVKGNMEVIWGL